jgi:hypothetical protein
MTVYFLETGEAHSIQNDIMVLECFDPETSLYLYEPADANSGPHFAGLTIPIFTTVSPNTSRYKEFTKNGGRSYYMPIWSLQDLLSAGAYLKESGRVPDDTLDLYSEQSIRERYDEFGGIFRHVLPESKKDIVRTYAKKRQAINGAIGKDILSIGDIEDDEVSHFILQYDVKIDGEYPFFYQDIAVC